MDGEASAAAGRCAALGAPPRRRPSVAAAEPRAERRRRSRRGRAGDAGDAQARPRPGRRHPAACRARGRPGGSRRTTCEAHGGAGARRGGDRRAAADGDVRIPFRGRAQEDRREHGALEAHRGALHLRRGDRLHRPGRGCARAPTSALGEQAARSCRSCPSSSRRRPPRSRSSRSSTPRSTRRRARSSSGGTSTSASPPRPRRG